MIYRRQGHDGGRGKAPARLSILERPSEDRLDVGLIGGGHAVKRIRRDGSRLVLKVARDGN
jgi:hypothetical protein